jgi:hypothetical protein
MENTMSSSSRVVMCEIHGKENPEMDRSVTPESEPAIMNVPSKTVSWRGMRNRLLQGSVEKPIDDPDCTSNVSEVSTSRMAPEIVDEDKTETQTTTVPVTDDTLPTRNEEESSPTPMHKCEGAPDMKPVSSEAETRGFWRHHRAAIRRNVHFSKPDFSKISQKVKAWRKKVKIGGEKRKTEKQETGDQGCGCFRWRRRRETDKTTSVPVADDALPTINEQESSPTPMDMCEGAPDMKPLSSEAETRGFWRHHRAPIRRSVHFSKPDYSKISQKMNAWRKEVKIGGKNRKTEKQETGDQGCRRQTNKTVTVPVADDALPTRNEQDIKPESSQSFRRNQPTWGHRILRSPRLDYRKFAPKMNSWRRTPKTGDED